MIPPLDTAEISLPWHVVLDKLNKLYLYSLHMELELVNQPSFSMNTVTSLLTLQPIYSMLIFPEDAIFFFHPCVL